LSKSIVLSEKVWAKLHTRLARDNHSSVMLIREKMKVVLGFTVRRHTEWIRNNKHDFSQSVTTIHLDFYNEPKRTMFLLKYSEYLDKTGITDS
jgi:hypothetical protein